MTEKVTKMHESGHFMIKVLTGVCGFMATNMTVALLWAGMAIGDYSNIGPNMFLGNI